MNFLEKKERRKEVLGLVDLVSRQHSNRVNFGSGGLAHEIQKFRVCWLLKEANIEFISEAKLAKGNGVIDVLDVENGVAYEIVDSEKEASKERKKGDWPFEVVFVNINTRLVTTKNFIKHI